MLGIRTAQFGQPEDHGPEDADGDEQLVTRAHRAADLLGRHFRQVQGGQADVDACIDRELEVILVYYYWKKKYYLQ